MTVESGSVLRMQEAKLKAERISLAVVTTGLVITAFDRLGSRSDREGTSAALNAMDFVVEIVMVVVFAALVFRAVNRPARSAPSRGTWMWISVGVIGALATIALLTLRIEGALAQSPARLRKAQAAVQSAERLTARINELMEAVGEEGVKMKATRAHDVLTGAVSPDEALTREEVREHREGMRRMADRIDELIHACRQAELRKLDSTALGVDVSLIRNCFVLLQVGTRGMLRKINLIDEHWDEWQSRGLRAKNGSYTPWQKELLRLEDEMKTAQKDFAAAREKLVQGLGE